MQFCNDYDHMFNQIAFRAFLVQTKKILACAVDQKNVSSLALNKTFPILNNYSTCTSKCYSEG